MSKCRSCGAEINWIELKSGKMHPVDTALLAGGEPRKMVLVTEDGRIIQDAGVDDVGYESHFATCPEADSWRKPSAAKKAIQDKVKKDGWL